MNEHIEFHNRAGYIYVTSLLKERQQELRALELNHRRMLARDFLSCRRSLRQAIKEIEALLLADPNQRSQNCPGGEDSCPETALKIA